MIVSRDSCGLSLDIFDARDGALAFCGHGTLVVCACACVTVRHEAWLAHDTRGSREERKKTHGLFRMDSEPVKKNAS